MRTIIRLSLLQLLFMAVAQAAPIPKLVARHFDSNFVPASLSNGFIGIRPGANPLIAITSLPPDVVGKPVTAPLATVVAGFVRNHPVFGVESWAPAPYPLGINLKVNKVSMLAFPAVDSVPASPGPMQVLSQSLDLSNGELETQMVFSAESVKVGVRVVQFASRSAPSLLCERILLTPSADTEMEIDTRIDTTNIPGTVYRNHGPARSYHEEESIDRVMGFRSDRSKLGVALTVATSPGVARRTTGTYLIAAQAGTTYTFDIIAAMVSEAYDPDPDLQAIRLAHWGKLLGWDELRRQNHEIWTELWKSRVEIDGDAEAQRALDAAFFYLHANSHPASRTGVPTYGFSQYEIYFGQIFWDMDSFMFPAALLTWPPTAKAMLEYRLRGMEAARKKASSFGYEGAQFPWEGATDGTDVTPTVWPEGYDELHPVPDVALAFWEYQMATQDPNFLHRATWPVLKSVAEWIATRGRFTARGFEIDRIEGPDEDSGNVNNGSYMNAVCKMVMQAAIECAKRVGAVPPDLWARIEREMYFPLDAQHKIILPYDGAVPGKRYSVGNLQLLLMHGEPVSSDLFRNTSAFEESLRGKDPLLASDPCSEKSVAFLCPAFASTEAFFGDPHKAAQMFRRTWQPYWIEPYGLARELSYSGDGSYITNYGALLMAAMLGFTGLRISDGDWARYPATLPEGWTRITVDRLWIKGKPMRVVAENGKRAVITEIRQ